MLKQAAYVVVFLFVVLASFIVLERTSSPFFQRCINEQTYADQKISNGKNEPAYSVIVSYSRCSGRFLDRHEAAVTALATVVIAAFTFTLWGATRESAATARKALTEIERAFLSLDGFDVELSLASDSKGPIDYESLPQWYKGYAELCITRFAILPRWKNSGSTPTRKMTIQVDWRGPPGPIPPEYRYRNPPKPFFVAPGATELSEVIEMPSARALVDWSMRPAGVEPIFFIWGRADYEDVFGKPHFIEWCYRLRFSRPNPNERMSASFIQWGDHNRAN